MRRVVVTGLGAVTPLGVGINHAWPALIKGRVGVQSTNECGPSFQHLPCRVAGLVPRGRRQDGKWDASEWLSRDEQKRMALFTQYAVAAAEEAFIDSGYRAVTKEQKEAMGVCVGSGIGNFRDVYDTSVAFEKSGYKKVSPLFVPRLLINLAAGHIAMRFGLQGPNTAPTTACTTSAHAIGDAARTIAFGDADVMLAGAAEACIEPLAIAGFARARSLSTAFNDTPENASRPFDKARDGFVMGEGAGILVLEELSHALNRNAKIYAELLGYGQSSDAHHMTAPLETGHGAYLAMKRALSHADKTASLSSLSPQSQYRAPPETTSLTTPLKIDYVNAHATGTTLGDIAEVKAILKACRPFDERPPSPSSSQKSNQIAQSNKLYITSTKGATAHLLGAAGAIEAIFTVLALKTGIVPPTANLEAVDEAILRLEHDGDGEVGGGVKEGEAPDGERKGNPNARLTADQRATLDFVPKVAKEDGNVKAALTNSFGFGGTNASLCFARWDG